MPDGMLPRPVGFISHLSSKEHVGNVWKVGPIQKWEVSLWHLTLHCHMVGCDALWCLTKLLEKPVRSKAKTSFPLRKTFSGVFCPSFHAKIPSGSDKTKAVAASKLTCLAVARLAVTSCIPSSVFFSVGGNKLQSSALDYLF